MGDKPIDRREFIGTTAAAAGAAAVILATGCGKTAPQKAEGPGQAVAQATGPGAATASPATGPKSRVVRVRNEASILNGIPKPDVVKQMVQTAVEKLSGKSGPDAWKVYLQPTDIVGVKINCLFPGAHTHKDVMLAVVAGIKSAGVPADNIIVWDRDDGSLTKCGYTLNKGAGVRLHGTAWEAAPVASGSVNDKIATLLTKITVLINVPLVKHHGMSGVSVSLKNHYGSISNPGALHGGQCDPFIADVNLIPAIREKQKLIIADALRPQMDGGPGAQQQHQWDYAAILAATDPVALDQVGLSILDAQRATKAIAPIGGAARHIATAAQKGLGTNDMAKIEIVEA